MKSVLFNIGPFPVHGYGTMIAIGIVAAMLVGMFRAKRAGLNADHVWGLGFVGMISGFAGGKLLYILVEWKQFLIDPKSVLGSSGFVVYGGIGIGLACVIIYCRVKKISFLEYIDVIIPSLSIGQGFGRLGCLMAGCCYGQAAGTHTFGVTFPAESLAPAGIALIPTQLYSSIGDFAIAVILIIVEVKTRKKGRTKGSILALYLILYSIGRFIIEFFRGDVRGSVGELSTSQFISIFTLAIGIALYLIQRSRKAKQA
ncbi:MAG: prolipoprotein diacylglyceryl transferase [Clostridiales bacterium]|nr:prolipoprotein diacylglyceryl transferase [Clostridiales bacterium]MBS5877998.1 prolipoprotein diacylglyceryl transferase [Clostridiales bacterium]MDU0939892.1 prolipoprotein diacylglyceryl transferase [Clostridiales bacterium]MDU1042426.1 prolipoprotein diacylglyceryl transferase [Clostridiales bacterium]MDU3489886.1 prolipoprotein diacylglyceryl transferase [Clostridiales bacterium]